jgi:hypothetical protein
MPAYILNCPPGELISPLTPNTSRLPPQHLYNYNNMAHPSRKTDTRTPASVASSSSGASTRSTHHFVGDRKAEAIHRWNDQVPDKLTDERGSKSLSDPCIQAYIEAKLALLRSITPTTG